jgi:predicted transposase/invertase (TIGR01784 family)
MSESKFLNPKNDQAFKHTFGTEKYKHVLMLFLNDILGFEEDSKIVEVSFLPTVQDPDIASKKTSIVDVICQDKKGVQYIIEMQVAKYSGFEKRALYYASKAYIRQLDKGDKEYSKLKEVIFIAITDYVVFPQKKAYKSDHIILDKETHDHDMKDITFTFIELPKYTKGKSEKLTSRIEQWCRFFKYGDDTTEQEVEEVVDPEVKEAYEAVNRFNWTEEELAGYEAELKRERDNSAVMSFAIAEGEAKGRAEGEAKGRAEGEARGEARAIETTAINMLKHGSDIKFVSSVTGLTEEEILKLKSKI